MLHPPDTHRQTHTHDNSIRVRSWGQTSATTWLSGDAQTYLGIGLRDVAHWFCSYSEGWKAPKAPPPQTMHEHIFKNTFSKCVTILNILRLFKTIINTAFLSANMAFQALVSTKHPQHICQRNVVIMSLLLTQWQDYRKFCNIVVVSEPLTGKGNLN